MRRTVGRSDGRTRTRAHFWPYRPTIRLSLAVCLLSCTPVTTRPDFLPDPQAVRLVLDAPPGRVTPEIAPLVAAETPPAERVNWRDGYVETASYETRSRPSFPGCSCTPQPAATVQIRCSA